MRVNMFWPHVEKTDTCWLWTGRTTRKGGRFGQGGYGMYANRLAHRIAYEITVGPIPTGMQLDHLCGVTRCVNPSHLEPVTPAENIRRHFAKQTHCKRGHEFSEANTYMRRSGGVRQCRACNREAVRAFKERNLARAMGDAA